MKYKTKTFHDISVDDDETCYVNFEEALMGELIRCARVVPGTDWKRINVQAEVCVYRNQSPKSKRAKKMCCHMNKCSGKRSRTARPIVEIEVVAWSAPRYFL